ncbi:MAG: hypothetical protein AAF762_08400 [Pseudomonadota bacterium]
MTVTPWDAQQDAIPARDERATEGTGDPGSDGSPGHSVETPTVACADSSREWQAMDTTPSHAEVGLEGQAMLAAPSSARPERFREPTPPAEDVPISGASVPRDVSPQPEGEAPATITETCQPGEGFGFGQPIRRRGRHRATD